MWNLYSNTTEPGNYFHIISYLFCSRDLHLAVPPRDIGQQLNCKFELHTGCPRRDVPDFGRVFLMVKYTDIIQNTYVQSWTVTEIMAREKCGLLAVPCTVAISWHTLSAFVFECGVMSPDTSSKLQQCYVSVCQSIVLGNLNDDYDIRGSFLVVKFHGFMSLTS
jgi:hypothetical protein